MGELCDDAAGIGSLGSDLASEWPISIRSKSIEGWRPVLTLYYLSHSSRSNHHWASISNSEGPWFQNLS